MLSVFLKVNKSQKQNWRKKILPKQNGQICFSILTVRDHLKLEILTSSFKYFRTIRIEEQIRPFVLGRIFFRQFCFWDLLTFRCATKFYKISTLLLSVCTVDKSKVEIHQKFVTFSEYRNFNIGPPKVAIELEFQLYQWIVRKTVFFAALDFYVYSEWIVNLLSDKDWQSFSTRGCFSASLGLKINIDSL